MTADIISVLGCCSVTCGKLGWDQRRVRAGRAVSVVSALLSENCEGKVQLNCHVSHAAWRSARAEIQQREKASVLFGEMLEDKLEPT